MRLRSCARGFVCYRTHLPVGIGSVDDEPTSLRRKGTPCCGLRTSDPRLFERCGTVATDDGHIVQSDLRRAVSNDRSVAVRCSRRTGKVRTARGRGWLLTQGPITYTAGSTRAATEPRLCASRQSGP